MQLPKLLRRGMAGALAMAIMGSAHAGLKEGVEATRVYDYERGFRELMPAAKAGSPLAQRLVGDYYGLGYGRPIDHTAAMEWFERAAQGNDAEAKAHLGAYYFWNNYGIKRDCPKAVKLLMEAAEQGDPSAATVLSRIYGDDACGPMDAAQSVKWMSKTAALGYPLEAFTVGLHYVQGKGSVRKNITEARKWFLLSANQGYGDAMRSLSILAVNDKDLVSAVTWMRLARQAGLSAVDERNLGIDSYSSQLTKEQQEEVDRRVAGFKPSSEWNTYLRSKWQQMLDEGARWDASHPPAQP